ncbi:MAG: hypothetical protein ABI203_05745 [Mucilaginibacter sp.]
MTQLQLIEQISDFDTPIEVVKLSSKLEDKDFSLRDMIDLTFYHHKPIALKASSLLETILVEFPEKYYNEIDYFFERMLEVTEPGCMKHYARAMTFLTSPEVSKDVRNKLKEIKLERVVELCFGWMIDPKMMVSVRSAASETLFNLRHRYPWIAEELSKQLEFLMPTATPSLAATADMILSYLHCED